MFPIDVMELGNFSSGTYFGKYLLSVRQTVGGSGYFETGIRTDTATAGA